MRDGSLTVPWQGWSRGLQEHPEQPVLFFLRGGQWRWWSYGDLATAGAAVATALSAEGADDNQRVNYDLGRPPHTLAIDLGIRSLGKVAGPRVQRSQTPNVKPPFVPPRLDDLETRRGSFSAAEMRPVGGVEVISPEGSDLRFLEKQVWSSERLAAGASVLDHHLEAARAEVESGFRRRNRSGAERPIALAAGRIDRIEERLWVEWAARRDAVLVLVGSEEALSWATSWIRPHYVLGGPVAARQTLVFAQEHEGSGRWARRLRRLDRWVLTEAVAGPPDLVEAWNARGVSLESFPYRELAEKGAS